MPEYEVMKNNENMNFLDLTATLSTIYSLIVPSRKLGDNKIQYHKNNYKFYVSKNDSGNTIINGMVSRNLREKLNEYKITLN
jgi:hypothetical protein